MSASQSLLGALVTLTLPCTDSGEPSGRACIITNKERDLGGIGSAVGRSLREQGVKLALLYAPFEAGNVTSVLEEVYGPGQHEDIHTYECDITDSISVEKAFEDISRASQAFPAILINSAGYVNLTALEETPPEDVLRHYMINLYGPTLTGQAFARAYIAAKKNKGDVPGGRIVNLASQAAHVALDKHGAYCASKAGLIGLTKCQANEWGCHGITANTVSPGPVWTALGKKAWGDDAVREEYLRGVPTGELAQPEEVAAVVSFLCQESSKNITGADMRLDGGYTAR